LVLGSAGCMYRLIRVRAQDEWMAFYTTSIFLFSMTTVVFARVVYSEWPYLLCSCGVLWLVLADGGRKKTWLKWVAVGAILGFSVLFRSIGLALILAAIAVILQDTWMKRIGSRRALLFAFLMIATTIVMYRAVTWTVHPEKGPGYEEQFLSKDIDFQEEGRAGFRDIIGRIPQNGGFFVKSLPPLVFGRTWHEYVLRIHPPWKSVVETMLCACGILLVVLMLLGFAHEVRRGVSAIEYYVFFYLAIMSMIWFNYEVYRYLMLIHPFLIFYALVGLRFLLGTRDKGGLILRVVWMVILAINVIHAGAEVYKYKFSQENARTKFRPYHETVSWLKRNAKPDEMLVADDPRWYALETGLPVTMFPITRQPEAVCRHLNRFHAPWVLYDHKRRFSKICLLPVLEQYPRRFRKVMEIEHMQIYRFVNDTTMR